MKKILIGVFLLLGFNLTITAGDFEIWVNPYTLKIYDDQQKEFLEEGALDTYLKKILSQRPSSTPRLWIFDIDNTAIFRKGSWQEIIETSLLPNCFKIWSESKFGNPTKGDPDKKEAKYLAFKPVLEFYNLLKKENNFQLIFLTMRSDSKAGKTLQQLRAAGYDVDGKEIYFTNGASKQDFYSKLNNTFPGFIIAGAIGDNDRDDKINNNLATPGCDLFNLILMWKYDQMGNLVQELGLDD